MQLVHKRDYWHVQSGRLDMQGFDAVFVIEQLMQSRGNGHCCEQVLVLGS